MVGYNDRIAGQQRRFNSMFASQHRIVIERQLVLPAVLNPKHIVFLRLAYRSARRPHD